MSVLVLGVPLTLGLDKILAIGGILLFCGPRLPSGGLGECVRNLEVSPLGVALGGGERAGSGEGVLFIGGLEGNEKSLGKAADDLLDTSLEFDI